MLSPFSHPLYVMAKPVGSACNLNCRYCYYIEKHTGGGVMSDAVLEAYIRQYMEAQSGQDILFTWHGGEPTLAGLPFYRRAMKLQKQYGQGMRISNSLQTNGTLLTDEWCRFLAQHGWLVGLSIDGPQPLHDEGRRTRSRASSFDRVMRAVQMLNKYRVEWNAMATVNRVNVRYPLEFYRFFRDNLRCEYLQFTPVGEELDADAWGEFLCAVYDEWVRSDVGRMFVQLFDATLANWVGEAPGVCSMAKTCGHAAVIESNGDVYMCDHFVDEAHRLGNIMNGDTLTSLLYSERQRQFGLDKDSALPEQCQLCEWLFACHGECPRLRTATTSDGETGLNCLCAGYRKFFAHVAQDMDFMASELRAGRPPANILLRNACK